MSTEDDSVCAAAAGVAAKVAVTAALPAFGTVRRLYSESAVTTGLRGFVVGFVHMMAPENRTPVALMTNRQGDDSLLFGLRNIAANVYPGVGNPWLRDA